MHFNSIAVAMAMLSAPSVIAAPIEGASIASANNNTSLTGVARFKPVMNSPAPNEQSCILSDPDKWDADYTCQIGVDWHNGNGCESIRKNLRNALSDLDSSGDTTFNDLYWECYAGDQNKRADYRNTEIRFATLQGYANKINPVLQAFWPMVNEFNCPDH